jgi:hypothetical protein
MHPDRVTDELVHKDMQFGGFRQIWTERHDGVFHGEYTVYWDGGPTVCRHGHYDNGLMDASGSTGTATGRSSNRHDSTATNSSTTGMNLHGSTHHHCLSRCEPSRA